MSSIHCKYLDTPHWKNRDEDPVSFETQIRIHRIFIPNYLQSIASLLELLEEAEIDRANKYYHVGDNQRFIIARGMLKILAGSYLGIKAKEVILTIGTNTKPFIHHSLPITLEYNVSHSGNWILIAFSNELVGVDVEAIHSSFQYESLLQVCFSSSEQKHIILGPHSRKLFYLLWTRKESFLKATSKGLSDRLPVLPSLNGQWLLQGQDGLGLNWEVTSFSVDQDHVASISFISDKKNKLFIE